MLVLPPVLPEGLVVAAPAAAAEPVAELAAQGAVAVLGDPVSMVVEWVVAVKVREQRHAASAGVPPEVGAES